MITISKAAKTIAKDVQPYFSIGIDKDFLNKNLEGKWSSFNDEEYLNSSECVNPWIVGLAVDYLSRMMITGNKTEAFRISLLFKTLPWFVQHPEDWTCYHADKLLEKITGLDNFSIIRACNLVCFDEIYRSQNMKDFKSSYKHCAELSPKEYETTCENIRVMVKRCVRFFEWCNPVPVTGFVVGNGYLHGDGDILTETEIWDIKTSRQQLSLADKIQVLLYWYIGLNTKGLDFSKISTLGIYNPRMNYSWKLEISQIPEDLIDDLHSICFYPFIV